MAVGAIERLAVPGADVPHVFRLPLLAFTSCLDIGPVCSLVDEETPNRVCHEETASTPDNDNDGDRLRSELGHVVRVASVETVAK